jgi:hydroxypyruvate reductase
MMELPLDDAISLPDLIEFHRELVHCGASIAEINCVRKHFSAVKGGRLAMAAEGLPAISLLVSDVPPACLDSLGSGPTLPDTSTVEDCRNVLARYGLLGRFPAAVRLFFEQQDLSETPKPGELASKSIVLLSSSDLAEAARQRAEALGFRAFVDSTCDDWDYRRAAEYLVGRLRELKKEFPRVCLISPGEVTVKVSGDAGIGGRNQHFALYAATLLRQSEGRSVILSAGSDGIDGNSRVAGAITNLQTLQKGKAAGLNAADSLRRFDSGSFLERTGNVIATGATGNNLRDLRILLTDADD